MKEFREKRKKKGNSGANTNLATPNANSPGMRDFPNSNTKHSQMDSINPVPILENPRSLENMRRKK
tara:strand:- start:102 stop:299 length:198 start_codon:yes stop_codon:yes gene_type:complete